MTDNHIGLAILVVTGTLLAGEVFAQEGEYAQQQRGKYLVAVGDCASCHTAKGGASLGGGRPIQTPFGVIYSMNITPDMQTGIGSWSDDEFYQAMHEGIAKDGSHLYPAMPYPWFTKVTREDSNAIRAYLRTLPAVKASPPENQLPWPLSDRFVMRGWNELYFDVGTYQPDASQSAQWNRGAYIVEGLGHCGACHTPTTMFGGSETSNAFHGAEIQNWYAPSLLGDSYAGLGNWGSKDIVSFLKTGKNKFTAAYGPMAEVIENSTSKMSGDDLAAIATYLKALPAPQAAKSGSPTGGSASQTAGKAIYHDACSACHQDNGEGVANLFPTLKGNSVVRSAKATTVVRLLLNGGHAASTAKSPTSPSMPAFGWKLSDQQIAAVASYIRNAWGNSASSVSASEVGELRDDLRNASTAN